MPLTSTLDIILPWEVSSLKTWLENLRRMKKDSDMTIEQISQASGVPASTVEKIFSGYTADPKLETIRKIVTSMGYTLDGLDPPEEGSARHEEMEFQGYLEELRTRPEMRMLFKAFKGTTKEEVEQVVRMIESFKKSSRK